MINTVVYADILIGTNIIINFFLLILTGKIAKSGYKTLRVILGAMLGGISSLYIFLPSQPYFAEIIARAAICLLIVFVSFGFDSVKDLLRRTAVFFGVTMLFGGIIICFWLIFKPNGVLINNGAVYFDISPTVLIVSTALSYAFITLLFRFLKKDVPIKGIIPAEIYYDGRKKEVSLLLDSGNSLKDPLSDRPVIIISKKAAQEILGKSIEENLSENDIKGYRLIPCTTVNGSGLLPAFKAEKIQLFKKTINSVIVAVSENAAGDNHEGITNPEILK